MSGIAGPVFAAVTAPLRYPVRALIGATVLSFAMFAVVRISVPYIIATTDPDLALFLSPGHPAGHLAKAERLRSELVELLKSAAAETSEADRQRPADSATDSIGALPAAPSPASTVDAAQIERARLIAAIRRHARAVIATEPLSAAAYRLLGETADTPDETRALMREAVRRSRREAIALVWLLNDSLLRSDYAEAMAHADVLLRTAPKLRPIVMGFLGSLLAVDPGRELLVRELARSPPWREAFFFALPMVAPSADASLGLLVELGRTDAPPTPKEVAPFLDDRIAKGEVDVAYNAWLQHLGAEASASLGFLTNPSFETIPSGLPFDWRFGRSQNAIVEIVRLADSEGAPRVLHVRFGSGRVKLSDVSQILLLPRGTYVLTGRLRGTVSGRRGLRWRVTCLGRRQALLGETEMLLGTSLPWRTFSLEFTHQADPADCSGQVLRLVHDARSASEEFVTGEVWIDELVLERRAKPPAE